MRGRLIVPFLVQLHRVDYAATAADPDGAGPLVSGFDPDFKEPIRLDTGESARKEHDPILVPCQPEDNVYDQLNQQAGGNDPTMRMVFTFHFEDLEEMNLVDPTTGNAMISTGDRATAIYRYEDETLIQQLGDDSVGFYCTEARPGSFGLIGGDRNLLICTFERRATTGGT
jgi:hypothetical protein